MSTSIKLEAEAYKSLVDLLEQADKTRALFEQARVPLPDALARLIRSNGHSPSADHNTAPFHPPTPPDADADSVWITMEDATTGTLALGVLRMSPVPLTVREIHEKVRGFERDVSVGTIANTGTRAFENGWITRDDEGKWTLIERDRAAIIHDGYVWGTPKALQMQELAAHRRAAILHLLRTNPTGLQNAQIQALLGNRDLLKHFVPMNKSLIKADMEALSANGKVRKRGNSKKWEVLQ